MTNDEFEFLRTLVYRHSRIALTPDKRELVKARLGRRLRATNLPSISEYCRLLKAPGQERELAGLIDAISTNFTSFFRERSHFDFVRDRAIPEFVLRARSERWHRIDAWSVPCSTGEEAYSLAITLAEGLAGTSLGWRIEASDISHTALAKAHAGIYENTALAPLPPNTVRTHFQRGVGEQEGRARVRPALRATVNFQQLNALEGEPSFGGPFQLIFCRNVMIYFDKPTQEELIGRLTRRLAPGGYLFIGHSETLGGIRHSLETVQPAVYRLRDRS